MFFDIKIATDRKLGVKDLILGKLSEYEIYSYYLGYAFIPGRVFNSPFRRDRKPSFGIFFTSTGELMYKDLGNPKYVGDCFKFVAQLQTPELSYVDGIYMVYRDLLAGKIKPLDRKSPIIYRGGKETTLRKQIDFVPKKFYSAFEQKYWSEVGLLLDDLKFFKIFIAKSVYVENCLKWEATEDNPIFIYKDFNKIKAYRPFEKNKARKWLSNYSRFDIQGWNQLPKLHNCTTLIITKSKKDVAILRKLGYLAIAPPAESILIPPEAMKILKEDFGFKKFVILYDRDDGGMKGSRKMWIKYRGEYDINPVFIGKNLPKDVDALYRMFDRHRTLSYLKRLFNYEPDETLSVVS